MMKKLLLSAVLLLSLQVPAWADSILPSIPGMVDTDNLPAQNTNTTSADSAAGGGGGGSILSGSGPINLRPGAYVAHNADGSASRSPAYVVPKISSVTAYNQSQQSAPSGEASPFSPGWNP